MAIEDCFSQPNSSKGESNNCVSPETLTILTENSRKIFMGVFVVLAIFSLLGNFLAIYSISKRKYRFIQKTCIISLAVSDILSTVVIATNNLETFSHEMLVWSLGAFLCSVIPMFQMVGILASSFALMIIAMDRYRNVIHALSKRWNPKRSTCVFITLSLWLIIIGISFPLSNFFTQNPVTILYIIDLEQQIYTTEDFQVCVSFQKDEILVYYIIMVIIIFLPLLVVFVFFYYNIASLVWKHRKPVGSGYQNEHSNLENSTTNSEVRLKNVKANQKCRDIKVERKIRTFKIIITLMLVFIGCRLPYFTVFILKLSLQDYGMWTWYLNYAFLALHIFNCCLNPLLYTFLQQTLSASIRIKRSIKDLFLEVCCFCFSKGAFDQFERENPFDHYNKSQRNSKVKFQENVKEIPPKF